MRHAEVNASSAGPQVLDTQWRGHVDGGRPTPAAQRPSEQGRFLAIPTLSRVIFYSAGWILPAGALDRQYLLGKMAESSAAALVTSEWVFVCLPHLAAIEAGTTALSYKKSTISWDESPKQHRNW